MKEQATMNRDSFSDEVFSKLKNKFTLIGKKEKWKNGSPKKRTAIITETISEIGDSDYNYTIAKPGNWAWLYDICWLEYEDFDNRLLKQLVLAAESEMATHTRDVRVDFNKLLVSRASILVMVYQTPTSSEKTKHTIDHYIELFQESIDCIRDSEINSLLCIGYDNQSEEFSFHTLTKGKLSPF